MDTGSSMTSMTELINALLGTTSDTIMEILASPIGSIALCLFFTVTIFKIFTNLFLGGPSHSYVSLDNDIIEDYCNDEIEEEIILNDYLVQQELKCHNCGAKLNLKKVKNSIIECEYCNTQYLIRNEEKYE